MLADYEWTQMTMNTQPHPGNRGREEKKKLLDNIKKDLHMLYWTLETEYMLGTIGDSEEEEKVEVEVEE